MFNDVLIFILSLWGLISLLLTFIFKMLLWRTEEFIFTIPLIKCDKDILNKIYNVRTFCEFCGIEKRSTVIVVNYGAPKCFCDEIKKHYENYDFLKITEAEGLSDIIKELHT